MGTILDPAKIPSLDGMRAALFGVVFLSHVWVAPGSFGVTGFFFLSGYLITTLLRREAESTGTIGLRGFYLRRVVRIFPALYLTIAIACALVALGAIASARISGAGLLAQCLHWTNYWKIAHGIEGVPAGTGLLWSLAVEEHFYLVYPLLYIGLRRWVPNPWSQAAVFAAICAAVLAWRAYLVLGVGVTANRTYMGTDTRVDSLLFGCILAVVGNPAYAAPARPGLWKYALLPASLAVLLFTFAFHRGGESADRPADWFREIPRYTLQGIALIPVFVCAIRYPMWWPFRLLNTRIAATFGVLSYGMYLLHHLAILVLEPHIDQHLALGVSAFALTAAGAYAIHRLVERPLGDLRRKLRSRAVERERVQERAAVA